MMSRHNRSLVTATLLIAALAAGVWSIAWSQDAAPDARGRSPRATDRDSLLRGQRLRGQRLRELRTFIETARHRRDELERHIGELQEHAEQAAGRLREAGLIPGSVDEALKMLTIKRLEHELELHGKQARLKAIEQMLGELRGEAGTISAADKLSLAEMKVAIEGKQLELARLKQLAKQNAVTRYEVSQAELELKRAMLQLEARTARLKAGNPSLAAQHLTEQLRQASVDITELTARQEYVHNRMEAYSKLVDADHQLRHITEQQIPAAHREMQNLADRIEQATQEIRRLERAPAEPEKSPEEQPPSKSDN